jgi:hypothetical protein
VLFFQPVAKTQSIQLDLFDKDSIKTATVDLAKMIEERKKELAELEQKYHQLRVWAGYAASAKQRHGLPDLRPPAQGREPSVQDEVVRILGEEKRPMKTMEIVVHLGTGANPKTVNWAMWNAARLGQIKRLEKGFYAALDYKPSKNGDGAKLEADDPLSRESASEDAGAT